MLKFNCHVFRFCWQRSRGARTTAREKRVQTNIVARRTRSEDGCRFCASIVCMKLLVIVNCVASLLTFVMLSRGNYAFLLLHLTCSVTENTK